MNSVPNNPFDLSALAVGEALFGREEELGWLMKGIQDGANSLLFGPGGIGKSALLQELGSRLTQTDGGSMIHLDLSRFPGLPDLTAAMKEAVARLRQTVPGLAADLSPNGPTHERRISPGPIAMPRGIHTLPTVMSPLGGAPLAAAPSSSANGTESENSPGRALLQTLAKLNEMAGGKSPVVLALDAFHEIMRLGGEGLARGMIDAMQKHTSLRHILTGTERGLNSLPDDLLKNGQNLVRTQKLGAPEPLAFAQWIDARFASADITAQGVGAACVDLAGANTAQVIELAHRSFALSVSSGLANELTVQTALGQSVAEKNDQFSGLWRGLSKEEQNVLRAVAQAGRKGGLEAHNFLRFGLETQGQAQAAIQALVQKEVLDQSTSSGLRITSAAMQQWTLETRMTSVQRSPYRFVSTQVTRVSFNINVSKNSAKNNLPTV